MRIAWSSAARKNMSRILLWMGAIACGSLLLGFAFFLIIESAAMILLYSSGHWQMPRRIVKRVTGVDMQGGGNALFAARSPAARVRIILNIAIRAGFMVVGAVMLYRLGFLRQNLVWLLSCG